MTLDIGNAIMNGVILVFILLLWVKLNEIAAAIDNLSEVEE